MQTRSVNKVFTASVLSWRRVCVTHSHVKGVDKGGGGREASAPQFFHHGVYSTQIAQILVMWVSSIRFTSPPPLLRLSMPLYLLM